MSITGSILTYAAAVMAFRLRPAEPAPLRLVADTVPEPAAVADVIVMPATDHAALPPPCAVSHVRRPGWRVVDTGRQVRLRREEGPRRTLQPHEAVMDWVGWLRAEDLAGVWMTGAKAYEAFCDWCEHEDAESMSRERWAVVVAAIPGVTLERRRTRGPEFDHLRRCGHGWLTAGAKTVVFRLADAEVVDMPARSKRASRPARPRPEAAGSRPRKAA